MMEGLMFGFGLAAAMVAVPVVIVLMCWFIAKLCGWVGF